MPRRFFLEDKTEKTPRKGISFRHRRRFKKKTPYKWLAVAVVVFVLLFFWERFLIIFGGQ